MHYFGEEFDDVNGLGAPMDDNIRNPKKKHAGKAALKKLLEDVKATYQKYKAKKT